MEKLELNGITYVREDLCCNKNHVDTEGLKAVLIRSCASGVHFGFFKEEKDLLSGKQVTLVNSRRVHYWEGACSISQLALEGTKKPDDCRISVTLPEITITQVIEVIPLSVASYNNLNSINEWKS